MKTKFSLDGEYWVWHRHNAHALWCKLGYIHKILRWLVK